MLAGGRQLQALVKGLQTARPKRAKAARRLGRCEALARAHFLRGAAAAECAGAGASSLDSSSLPSSLSSSLPLGGSLPALRDWPLLAGFSALAFSPSAFFSPPSSPSSLSLSLGGSMPAVADWPAAGAGRRGRRGLQLGRRWSRARARPAAAAAADRAMRSRTAACAHAVLPPLQGASRGSPGIALFLT